jgi:hypothetical protein
MVNLILNLIKLKWNKTLGNLHFLGEAGPGSSMLEVMNTGALFSNVKRRNYRYDLYERHYKDGHCDPIHWNKTGIEVVLEYLQNRLR